MTMFKAVCLRAATIVREEGPISLLRRAGGFGVFLSRRAYRRLDVYLYRHPLTERERSRYLPRLDSCEMRIVESAAQAEQLVTEGFEDFRERFLYSRRNLFLGAVAFCVYEDMHLAHIGWVALDERAKTCVDELPFQVSFDNGEACSGGSYTVPGYRGKGLMTYGFYERLEYLRVKGFKYVLNSVGVHNAPSQRVHAKFSPEVTGVGRLKRFFGWSRWTEYPFPDAPAIGMPPPWDPEHRDGT